MLYEREDVLNKGAFGVVSKCTHKITKKQFAMKFGNKDELLYEATILSKLQLYKHVPTLQWHGKCDGVNTMVFELLSYTIKDLKPRFWNTYSKTLIHDDLNDYIMSLFNQTMDGLKWIHKKGILHRDIKPDNIMLKHDHKTVTIIDYGMAKGYLKDKLHVPCSNISSIIGSLSYCSLNVNNYVIPSRRDDVISVLYSFFSFIYDSLPWEQLKFESSQSMIDINRDVFNEKRDFVDVDKQHLFIHNNIASISDYLNHLYSKLLCIGYMELPPYTIIPTK